MRKYPDRPTKVYFFGTCLIDSVYPEAGLAAIRLLQREGVRVVYPQSQSCCGQPAYNSGYLEEARAVARNQIAAFPKDYPVIVPSGSCAGMMRCHYPEMFADDPDFAQVEAFAQRVYELSEFLVQVLQVSHEDRGRPLQATWHSSCHALREMGIIADSKSLLHQMQHVDLLDLEYETECCGFGGTFSVKQPLISGAMVRDKVRDIERTGASVVLSGDCGCLLNIQGALDKAGSAVKSQHIAQFIWERTNAN